MQITVTGVPDGRVTEAQALIDGVLDPLIGTNGALMIAAHRLHGGEWLFMVFDGANFEALKGDIVDRLRSALRGVPNVP